MRFAIFCSLGLLSVFSLSSMSNAQTTAVSNIVSPTVWGGDYCLGWEFTVNFPISVTQLGVFDEGSNGLAGSHAVGIFRVSDEALLVNTTITTLNPLDNTFRYGSVTPTVLIPGGNYRIGAVYNIGVDAYAENCASFTMAGAINFIDECYRPGAVLSMPNQQQGFGIQGYFTANFKFANASAPEPGTLALVILGSSMLLAKRKKKNAAF
jgi:hypothetical protein